MKMKNLLKTSLLTSCLLEMTLPVVGGKPRIKTQTTDSDSSNIRQIQTREDCKECRRIKTMHSVANNPKVIEFFNQMQGDPTKIVEFLDLCWKVGMEERKKSFFEKCFWRNKKQEKRLDCFGPKCFKNKEECFGKDRKKRGKEEKFNSDWEKYKKNKEQESGEPRNGDSFKRKDYRRPATFFQNW